MPKKHSGNNLAEPRHAPKYSEKERNVILRFLAACLIDAEQARGTALHSYTRSGKLPEFLGQLTYWDNVCKGIRWLGHRALQNQKHLLAFDDSELKGMMKQWESTSETH